MILNEGVRATPNVILKKNRGLSVSVFADESRDSEHIQMVTIIGDSLVRLELEASLRAHLFKGQIWLRNVCSRGNFPLDNDSLSHTHQRSDCES